jgi:hypothetical protein
MDFSLDPALAVTLTLVITLALHQRITVFPCTLTACIFATLLCTT